jgi:hypothetical protein
MRFFEVKGGFGGCLRATKGARMTTKRRERTTKGATKTTNRAAKMTENASFYHEVHEGHEDFLDRIYGINRILDTD